MAYSIVNFSDKSFDIAPSTWVNGDKCFWPPRNVLKGNALSKAVEDCEAPDLEWDIFECEVLKTYDDYQKARKRCAKAEQRIKAGASGIDLQSTDCDGKRKRRPPAKFMEAADAGTDSDESISRRHNSQKQRKIPPSPPPVPSMSSSVDTGKTNEHKEQAEEQYPGVEVTQPDSPATLRKNNLGFQTLGDGMQQSEVINQVKQRSTTKQSSQTAAKDNPTSGDQALDSNEKPTKERTPWKSVKPRPQMQGARNEVRSPFESLAFSDHMGELDEGSVEEIYPLSSQSQYSRSASTPGTSKGRVVSEQMTDRAPSSSTKSAVHREQMVILQEILMQQRKNGALLQAIYNRTERTNTQNDDIMDLKSCRLRKSAMRPKKWKVTSVRFQ